MKTVKQTQPRLIIHWGRVAELIGEIVLIFFSIFVFWAVAWILA